MKINKSLLKTIIFVLLMELFERIYQLKFVAGNLQGVADALGIAPQKISAYSNEKSQKNFYPLLPNVLRAYPQISREWLYFGEGEMLANPKAEEKEAALLEERVKELAQANANLSEMNLKLIDQNQKLMDRNHNLMEELLKKNLKGE